MSETASLLDDLASSTHELRGSLTELLGGVGVDARRAQIVAKQLQLDKSLAWKISNIVKSDHPGVAIKHLPGANAFEILLNAAQGAGASARSIKRAASAYKAIKDVVERHTGDRPTLELVMDAMPGRAEDRLIVSRKLAFRGNSGVWGVQAKARINAAFVAPNPDDSDIQDIAQVGAWVDFRRLRTDARWGLFRIQAFDTSKGVALPFTPIDPDESPTGPMLLRSFCTASMPDIKPEKDGSGDLVYEIGNSSIGNAGAFTCFYGSKIPRIASRWASPQMKRGEFGATISAPVEALQFDMFVHRDLDFASHMTTTVYGVLNLTPATRHERDVIPLALTRTDLGRFPPVVDTPHTPAYSKVVEFTMRQCGWDMKDFIGVRYTLAYPPYPSTVIISFPLQER